MFDAARRLGAAGVAVAALAVPATAAAATKTVTAGPPPAIKALISKLHATALGKYSPDVNAFFNQHATIHVGDKITFRILGFHDIDIPASGQGDLPLVTTGATVTGVNDAAGSPFWFNGKVPSLGFNPALFKPSGPTRFNGKTRFDSGLPLGPSAPKPFSITFTKAGTYKYFCDVHPGMVGYITVKPKTAQIPTAKQDAAALTKQETGDIKDAVKVLKAKIPADTVDLGQSTPGGVELYDMFPATLTVTPGTVVTFQMSQHSREVHTATFGPSDVLTKLANSFGPQLPPEGAYPSDPTQPVQESTANHGNGFANVGLLDRDAGTPTIPAVGKVQFTTPGTYTFICLIHSNMRGTIVVR